ncbi:uncharacterized protein LOC101737270 isoform X3 [Bombyx mori]|uniref:Uncharacterized protein n=1 Tax=Bombyx mori TaxID=7091 RepID=A0A8R2GAS4_BOMMO|nr:uncharacterized protein LOC101737270 isoform X1 [Bombyx mori]
MISSIISRLVILVFGTLYPAYASYKAVRTKNLKEYVKWMMYWIVFALFTCTETFTDVFLSWFPFYYEVKIVLVLWLLSPATKGSSILYRKFVHPALCRREQEIDEYIAKAKDQGYHTVLNLGTKGVNYATTVIMQTAIKGGGGLVQQIRKSYSLSDLTECEPREERGEDEADDVLTEPRLIRRGPKSGYRRSASESNSRQPMYFPEVDVDVRSPRPRTDEPDFSHIKSSEDISSGYSSADNSGSLTRTSSLGASARTKARPVRTTVTTIKRPQAAEGSEVIIEELHDDDAFEFANIPPLVQYSTPLFLSHTDPPFLYKYVDNQVKILQVLGNYPLQSSSNNESNNADTWDQKEVNFKETTLSKDSEKVIDNVDENIVVYERKQNNNLDIPFHSEAKENKPINQHETHSFVDKNNETLVYNVNSDANIDIEGHENKYTSAIDTDTSAIDTDTRTIDTETRTVDTDNINVQTEATVDICSIDSADDEASFGTPDNSPKSKRKSPKGKYGKGKAPPPPVPAAEKQLIQHDIHQTAEDFSNNMTELQKSSIDIANNTRDEKTIIENDSETLGDSKPAKRVRDKSKSPARMLINSSSISRLLQLPGKLAFWSKTDDQHRSEGGGKEGDDNDSSTSTCNSRRSSTADKIIDEFQSCHDLSNPCGVTKVPEIEITCDPKDCVEAYNNENITKTSDALQKIIDAKLENYPEYKFLSLHEEIQTTSKSTDV